MRDSMADAINQMTLGDGLYRIGQFVIAIAVISNLPLLWPIVPVLLLFWFVSRKKGPLSDAFRLFLTSAAIGIFLAWAAVKAGTTLWVQSPIETEIALRDYDTALESISGRLLDIKQATWKWILLVLFAGALSTALRFRGAPESLSFLRNVIAGVIVAISFFSGLRVEEYGHARDNRSLIVQQRSALAERIERYERERKDLIESTRLALIVNYRKEALLESLVKLLESIRERSLVLDDVSADIQQVYEEASRDVVSCEARSSQVEWKNACALFSKEDYQRYVDLEESARRDVLASLISGSTKDHPLLPGEVRVEPISLPKLDGSSSHSDIENAHAELAEKKAALVRLRQENNFKDHRHSIERSTLDQVVRDLTPEALAAEGWHHLVSEVVSIVAGEIGVAALNAALQDKQSMTAARIRLAARSIVQKIGMDSLRTRINDMVRTRLLSISSTIRAGQSRVTSVEKVIDEYRRIYPEKAEARSSSTVSKPLEAYNATLDPTLATKSVRLPNEDVLAQAVRLALVGSSHQETLGLRGTEAALYRRLRQANAESIYSAASAHVMPTVTDGGVLSRQAAMRLVAWNAGARDSYDYQDWEWRRQERARVEKFKRELYEREVIRKRQFEAQIRPRPRAGR